MPKVIIKPPIFVRSERREPLLPIALRGSRIRHNISGNQQNLMPKTSAS